MISLALESGKKCSNIRNICSRNKYTMDSAANTLFGKTRQAVLVLLFEQPNAAFYLREISRLTGLSPGQLQTELTQLTDADLVLRTMDGNRISYQANRQHPVFGELQALVGKTCGLPSRIRTALEPAAKEIQFAAIYGSFAKGGNHARSDIDLIVVGEISLEALVSLIQPVEEQSGREISIRLYGLTDFKKRQESGDHFLQSVLNGPLIPLMGQAHDA